MSDVWFTIPYRDKEDRKYFIFVEKKDKQAGTIDTHIIIRILLNNVEKCVFTIRFFDDQLIKYGINFNIKFSRDFIEEIIKDFIFGKSFDEIFFKEISFSLGNENSKRVIIIEKERSILRYKRDPRIIAIENKIAREIVLKELYNHQSILGTTFSMNDFYKACNYYLNNINVARDALVSRGFIDLKDGGAGKLTYDGMVFVEDMLLSPYSNKIFLIAACNDYVYDLIDKVYRPAAKKFGYELIFQEKNEPKDTIHEDIWENIENCKMIICDLSYQRPNCFIEYGYAYGKGKKIILCVEESQGKDAEKRLNVPFDTQPQKYSFWQENWLDEDNEAELNTYRKEIEDRLEMKLTILDSQSEI